MTTTEIRVRPVVRHAVTRYVREERQGSSEMIGEFANEAYAEEVAEALKQMTAPREFVMVQETPGVTNPEVRYAYSEDEVASFLSQPSTSEYGFKVYSRVLPTLKY